MSLEEGFVMKELYTYVCIMFQYYGQPSYMPPTHPPSAPPQSADKGKEDLSKGDPKADLKVSFRSWHYYLMTKPN